MTHHKMWPNTILVTAGPPQGVTSCQHLLCLGACTQKLTHRSESAALWQVRCIVGTELCERFSFYGLRSILLTFLTGQLGQKPSTAEAVFHLFSAGCYLMPLAGAYIAGGDAL